jgi:hypothetical protein
MASYLLKLSVCYFNVQLSMIKFNVVGDNSGSHDIQQSMIYNTHKLIEVFRVIIY